MKKLIAMLLCVALVASFGVTSAFALTMTNADSEAIYRGISSAHKDWQSFEKAVAAMGTSVERIYFDYYMAAEKIYADTDMTDAEKDAAVKMLQVDAQLALSDLAASDAAVAAELKAANADAFKFNPANGFNFLDDVIKTYTDYASGDGDAAEYWGVLATMYGKLAAKDAEKAAAAKEKEARDALVAKLIAGIDTSTPAGKLLADATVAKYDAEAAVKAAQKNAETAKKAIDVAKKGAFTSAQAAVLDAQAFAYNQMASEITTAVNDYVAGVYVAIADFYANMG